MRRRLASTPLGLSPERALDTLRRIQHHQIRLNQGSTPVTGISQLTPAQNEVFDALSLKKPTQPHQLALL
jgi:hypothetical protein